MWRDNLTPEPKFFISIRCGSGPEVAMDFSESKLKINSVRRARNSHDNRLIENVWGTATGTSNQYDDKLFDYHKNNFLPVPKSHPTEQGGLQDPTDLVITPLTS